VPALIPQSDKNVPALMCARLRQASMVHGQHGNAGMTRMRTDTQRLVGPVLQSDSDDATATTAAGGTLPSHTLDQIY
jgi:hypothetical protein